jgi:hypothetical protein
MVSHLDRLEGAPTVTYATVGHTNAGLHDSGIEIPKFKAHLYESVIMNKGITNFERAGVTDGAGAAALCDLVHPEGSWMANSLDARPTWVWSDEPEFGKMLSDFYEIPYGRPNDLFLTHYTQFGPPGSTPPVISPLVANVKDIVNLLVNTGRDMWAQGQGRSQVVLAQQTATASSTTTITGTGTPFTASAYIGMIVVDNTTGVWGNIQSNTTSQLTVDRWYNPATPGSTAGSTPGTTDKFTIVQGVSPAQFMGITANSSAASATDTQLTGEIVTSGGALVRAVTTYAHSAGTNTYTSANTFTANGTDTVPVTIAKMALFNSIVVASTINMWFETLLNATATLTISGDAVTITDTVTGS